MRFVLWSLCVELPADSRILPTMSRVVRDRENKRNSSRKDGWMYNKHRAQLTAGSLRLFNMPLRVALLVFACRLLVGAQFDVASVKPSAAHTGFAPGSASKAPGLYPGGKEGGPGTSDPTRVRYWDTSLAMLIDEAFQVLPGQISGPAWLAKQPDLLSPTDKFDIDATVPPGATNEDFRGMLQALLADRFGLKAHRETREGPVYNLVVAKNGPKLQQSAEVADAPPSDVKRGPIGKDGFPTMPQGYSGMFAHVTGVIRVKFLRWSMPQFARWLLGTVGKPVIDRTDLKGPYDFYLEYASQPKAEPLDAAGNSEAPDAGAADIFTAIPGQLGLKLVAGTGQFEVLAIDHVNRAPSEN